MIPASERAFLTPSDDSSSRLFYTSEGFLLYSLLKESCHQALSHKTHCTAPKIYEFLSPCSFMSEQGWPWKGDCPDWLTETSTAAHTQPKEPQKLTLESGKNGKDRKEKWEMRKINPISFQFFMYLLTQAIRSWKMSLGKSGCSKPRK